MALDYVKARKLAAELIELLPFRSRQEAMAMKLWTMLEPPLTMEEILARIPGATHNDRAEKLKISRQAYYNLRVGSCLPSTDTRARLARLTGVPAEVIRGIVRNG